MIGTMTDDPPPAMPGAGRGDDADPEPAERGSAHGSAPVPDYAAPDRPRGLDAYFPPGGEDDASPERIADERRLIRLLILMVALLIGIPTVLTIIGFAGQLLTMRSGG
jgi:hypothetical protein